MDSVIGIGKSARQAYGFDDIAIVPSRRTHDPDDVDISWEIDAYKFDLPLMASAMDAVVSPASAVLIGKLGGLAVLNLEGLAQPLRGRRCHPSRRSRASDRRHAPPRCRSSTSQPVKEDLMARADLRDQGRRRHRRGQPHASDRCESTPSIVARGGSGHPGDPGDGRLGGAHVRPRPRAAEPQGVHRPPSTFRSSWGDVPPTSRRFT